MVAAMSTVNEVVLRPGGIAFEPLAAAADELDVAADELDVAADELDELQDAAVRATTTTAGPTQPSLRTPRNAPPPCEWGR